MRQRRQRGWKTVGPAKRSERRREERAREKAVVDNETRSESHVPVGTVQRRRPSMKIRVRRGWRRLEGKLLSPAGALSRASWVREVARRPGRLGKLGRGRGPFFQKSELTGEEIVD